MRKFLIHSILLFKFLFVFGQKTTNKPVTTLLNAQWPETPYILEIAEYLWDENPSFFWSFLDEINKLDIYNKGSEKEKFFHVLDVTKTFLSPSQISLLKFSLALRVYSPKIESFRQIALDRGLGDKDCSAVVEINERLLCHPFTVDEVKSNFDENNADMVYFSVDHVYENDNKNNIAILYAELGTKEFMDAHRVLKSLADERQISYIYRPYVQKPASRNLRMSGYGVELQIKSTEYKAQDDTKLQEDPPVEGNVEDTDDEVEGFLISKLKKLHPEHADKLQQLRANLIESTKDMTPLKVWQMQHLSMQAAQRIMSLNESTEKLSSFINIAQNFPSLARSLIRTKVDDKLKKEVQKNQNSFSYLDISSNDASLSINGVSFDLDNFDIFSILDFLKNEQKVMERLYKLGIKDETLSQLLNLDISETKTQYGVDIRDTAVNFLNDIEKDSSYSRWPSSLGELLRPAFPGMLRSIRKNLHNFVLIADPLQKQSIDLLKTIDSFLSHVSPLRFGVVWMANANRKVIGHEDPSVAMVSAFNYVVQSLDADDETRYIKGIKFILDFHEHHKEKSISSDDIKAFFKSKYKNEDLEDVFGSDSQFDYGRQIASQFIDKSGFSTAPQVLFNGVPLPQEELTDTEFEELLLTEVMKNTQVFQRAIFSGDISDIQSPLDWLMAQPHIMPRINERILTTKHSKYIDLSETSPDGSTLYDITHEEFTSLSPQVMTRVVSSSCRYVTFRRDLILRPLTKWVIGDFETEAGRQHLRTALQYTRESNRVRLCALSNSANPGVFSKVIEVAQASLPGAILRSFFDKILDANNADQIISGEKSLMDFAVNGLDKDGFESRLSSFKHHVLKSQILYNSKVLGIPLGKSAIVANGRMLGVMRPEEQFSEGDYALLEKFTSSSIGEKISKVLKKMDNFNEAESSDLHMRVIAVLQSKSQSRPRSKINVKSDQFSVIKLDARKPDDPAFDILAICDPLSVGAQKIGPIVQALHQVINSNVRVVLNPNIRNSEMPLKRFYRYVLPIEPTFSASGDLSPGSVAKFTGLSETTIYTQNYDTPDNWLVEAVKSVYDLDNIKLEQVEVGVHSEFELENLLLEGHCFEQSSGNPPRGLQFTLGTRQNPLMVDTIVMANLGYLQLKASPGAMIIRLREGRSSDIYTIVGHDGTERPPGTKDVMVVINSFQSHLIKMKVAKKPSMVDQDLLVEDDESGGIWDTISSTFGKYDKEDSVEDEYINIFSVASGHLYERFLRIMMVSVRKHSSKPVKFWIIKNFLSPTFKDSLRALADSFDFKYELVQYKWPTWLHQQTEKQRMIWGYKILFLDVLFPLHVKKIIFVDADQVVRADMKELHDLDLGGAPYGFVPFCDSRKEMDGFRFWKSGYWRSHLSGRKYHISALFVVDLKKFRRIAAGDRLRGQYQGLSQDPNSLSNLDQDLPNNMIHQVKIKSLPLEWLWCETWCDDSSKKNAKVIDLCNNPLTKEAKLTAATRIIAEWTSLDEEIKKALKHSTKSPTPDSKEKTDKIEL